MIREVHGYRIDDTPIARGGQGTVHRAHGPGGTPVAVKIAAPDRSAREALLREIALLRHMGDAGVPGVMPVLDSFEYDGRPAMVMPYYPEHLGTWLERVILHPRSDTLREILQVHHRIARILAGVHSVYYEGGTVVHRDIKPENLFRDREGRIWLGDFGGAMAVEELRAVELAMFGTPMWAPLDQLLPGVVMPDPTWDTYAVCVMLYAAITGARPAYQSDPRELLTPAGRALWEAARHAVEARGPEKVAASRRFTTMRRGTTAADLVDLTGRAALVAADRRALQEGLDRLASLAAVAPSSRQKLERGLWNLLARGLSPLSHPSPPNRYRDAGELADAIEELEQWAVPSTDRLDHLLRADLSLEHDGESPRRSTLVVGSSIVGALLLLLLLLGGGVGLWFAKPTLVKAFLAARPLPPRVTVGPGVVHPDEPGGEPLHVGPFSIDTTEVDVAAYRRCVEDGACAHRPGLGTLDRPAAPLSFADATALCAHRGGDVPTEAQWLLTHGPARFPWGDAPATCDRAIGLGCAETLAPVGTARLGASPAGAVDLAGNAWEWVRADDGAAVLRGGDLRSSARELGRAGRKVPPEGAAPDTAGVRCVYMGGTP